MISVVLPTYKEAANVPELLRRVTAALGKEAHEIIIVDDDSPDRTWEVAENLKKTYPSLTVIRRIGRKGLSSAVMEGLNAAKGDVLVSMDSDLQHDPAIANQLVEKIRAGATVAVASRYVEGGSVGEWVTGRRLLSRVGTFLARTLPPVRVSDPLSGFFAVNADAYRKVSSSLRPAGFKILLEILAFLPRSATSADVPLTFQMREHGESKLSFWVEVAFLWQLLRIAMHRIGSTFFWVVVFVVAAILGWRVLHIAPIYKDADLRASAQSTIQRVVDENGWLMSDVSIRNVNREWVEIVHRHHHLGADESTCIRLSLFSNRTLSCAD